MSLIDRPACGSSLCFQTASTCIDDAGLDTPPVLHGRTPFIDGTGHRRGPLRCGPGWLRNGRTGRAAR